MLILIYHLFDLKKINIINLKLKRSQGNNKISFNWFCDIRYKNIQEFYRTENFDVALKNVTEEFGVLDT